MDMQRWIAKNCLYLPVVAIQAGPVLRYLSELERRQYDSDVTHRRHQVAALRRLVSHARDHVPYYTKALAGLDPGDIRSLDDIRSLPFLTKTDLQLRWDELRSRGPVGRLIPKTTGGSTGHPVTVLKSRGAWARELAAAWRGYRWVGIDIGDLQARFWGVPYQTRDRWRARLTDAVCHRIRFSAFRFNDESIRQYVRIMKRRRPRYFYGYVSMLKELADFMQREKIRLSFPLICAITTSEVLTEGVRELLQTVFEAPVYDEYGCGELGTIAHECPYRSKHINEENMILEVLDGDRPCADGESGELVITELSNVGMPMLRYRTGDFGTIRPGRCACGRNLRRLRGVHGRAYDFIQGSDGRLLHGEFVMYVFEEIRRIGAGIRQFQVIQEAPDRFRVKIVREHGYGPATEDLIVRRFREHVHANPDLRFEYVERIDRESSGKMRLIVGMDSASPD